MTRTSSNRIDTAKQPRLANLDLDAFLIDEDFDDFLDRQIADFRESLGGFRSL